MKTLKWILLVLLLLLMTGATWRGELYRLFVNYRSIGQRINYPIRDTALIGYIESEAAEKKISDAEDVIALALSITSGRLNFTTDKNYNDPNLLIHTGTANCIGYSAFFSTTCNHLLKKYNYADTLVATPQIGQLYFLKKNIHEYVSDPFFKDHDFVLIENKKTGETYAVDPTVNDCLLIRYVTYKK